MLLSAKETGSGLLPVIRYLPFPCMFDDYEDVTTGDNPVTREGLVCLSLKTVSNIFLSYLYYLYIMTAWDPTESRNLVCLNICHVA